MTDTIRSINLTHKNLPNVTFRIGVSSRPSEDPQAVVEFHVRNGNAVTEVAGSLTVEQFTQLAREAVSIGNSVVPKPDVVD